ncbi:MAG: 4-hydroxybenzoate octaprenyltransferase [Burkholderiales bacterium]
MSRWSLYLKLIRFDKPVGTLLLLWPTLTALWIASGGLPRWDLLLIFCMGTFLMRSAGCAMNDVADRDYDRHVARTRDRVVTSGQVSVQEALLVAVILVMMAGVLILPLPKSVWILAVVAVVLAATYPFFKRFFSLPQAYLGVAFSFGIPMAFAAVQGSVPWQAWGLMLANAFWVLAYDTEYALVDKADDLKIGIKTSAITLGTWVVPAILLFYALFLAGTSLMGSWLGLGWPFLVGIAVASALAGWHYGLIKGQQPESCFHAFRSNHWLGAAIFVGTVMNDLA